MRPLIVCAALLVAVPAHAKTFAKKPLNKRALQLLQTKLRRARGATRAPLLYKIARIYYEANHHAAAVKWFARVIDKHPSSNLAGYAGNLLLDALNIQRDYKAMARWVKRMLSNRHLQAHRQLGRVLRQLSIGIARKAADALQRRKRYRACGDAYAALYRRVRRRGWRYRREPELLYNAAICYEAAGRRNSSMKLMRKLVVSYPRSRLAAGALMRLANNLAASKRYKYAAGAFARLAAMYPASKHARRALLGAIQAYLLSRQVKQARAAYRRLVSRFRRHHTRRILVDQARALFTRAGVSPTEKPERGILRRWRPKRPPATP